MKLKRISLNNLKHGMEVYVYGRLQAYPVDRYKTFTGNKVKVDVFKELGYKYWTEEQQDYFYYSLEGASIFVRE